MTLDEFYSDNLGEEVTRGMRESVSRGFYLSSKPPYGSRKIRVRDGNKDRTKLEIDAIQSVVVKQIFEDMASGRRLIEIIREFNARSISGPKGKDSGKSGVYFILTNEIYTGTFIWGKHSKRGNDPVRSENMCPPLIDRDTFLKVQRLIQERIPQRIHPRRTSSPFFLSGIAFCGHCRKALIGRYAKNG